MPFIPNTDRERQEMLTAIGVESFTDLLENIPEHLRLKEELALPQPLSELEITAMMNGISEQNSTSNSHISFLGGGIYDHFIPAAVGHILSRSEFYTAYTPYQAEVSQGTLQTIYEFQSMICELTAMDVANASMYDGGSALAEAVLLAHAQTRRKEVLISTMVNPHYREIVKTYCHGQKINVIEIGNVSGITHVDDLGQKISENTIAVVVQHPNYFGCLEDVGKISSVTHAAGALFITSNDPISLGILSPPGEYGADIATGEGQGLGNPMNFGGPGLGIFATTQKLIRRMPGRVAGATVDSQGRPGFVLTLQTREQHIRRDKATSNICTNQALNALAATVYLALMGKCGVQKVAELCLQKSHYLADRITELDGFDLAFEQPFFKEFVVKTPCPVNEIIEKAQSKGYFAGIPIKTENAPANNFLLCAVTEKRTKKEMDSFIEFLREHFS